MTIFSWFTAFVVIGSIATSFFMIYRHNRLKNEPMECAAQQLKPFDFTPHSISVRRLSEQDVSRGDYNLEDLLKKYMSANQVSVLASLEQDIDRLEQGYRKTVSLLANYSAKKDSVEELRLSSSKLSCSQQLISPNQLSKAYREMSAVKQNYQTELKLISQVESPFKLHDLHYKKTLLQADINTLNKLIKFEGDSRGIYIDRQKLLQRKQKLSSQLSQLRGMRVRSQIQIENDIIRAKNKKNLLQLQLEERRLAKEYNGLKDEIMRAIKDLTKYKQKLKEAIEFTSKLSNPSQKLSNIKLMQEQFKSIIIVTNQLTYHSSIKEKLNDYQISKLLNQLDLEIRQLQDQKLRKNKIQLSISEIGKEMADIDLQLLSTAPQNVDKQDLLNELDRKKMQLGQVINLIQQTNTNFKPDHNFHSFKKIQKQYQEKLDQFNKKFKLANKLVKDCVRVSSEQIVNSKLLNDNKQVLRQIWESLRAEAGKSIQLTQLLNK